MVESENTKQNRLEKKRSLAQKNQLATNRNPWPMEGWNCSKIQPKMRWHLWIHSKSMARREAVGSERLQRNLVDEIGRTIFQLPPTKKRRLICFECDVDGCDTAAN
jgi:hypothetical protein